MSVLLENRSTAPSIPDFLLFEEVHDSITREFLQSLDAVLDDEGLPIPAQTLARIIHQEFDFGYTEPYNIGDQVLSAVKKKGALPFTSVVNGKSEIPGFGRTTALAFGLLCEARGRFFPATFITDFEQIQNQAIKQAGGSRLAAVLRGEQVRDEVKVHPQVEIHRIEEELKKLGFFDHVAQEPYTQELYIQAVAENADRIARGDRAFNLSVRILSRRKSATAADLEEAQRRQNAMLRMYSEAEYSNGQQNHHGDNEAGLRVVFNSEDDPTDEELLEAERELNAEGAEDVPIDVSIEDDQKLFTEHLVSLKSGDAVKPEPSIAEMKVELKSWDYSKLRALNQLLIDHGKINPVLVDSINPREFGVSDYVATRIENLALRIYRGMRERYRRMVAMDEHFEDKMIRFGEMFDPEFGADTIEGYRVKVVGLVLHFFAQQPEDKKITLVDISLYGDRMSHLVEDAPKRGRPRKIK